MKTKELETLISKVIVAVRPSPVDGPLNSCLKLVSKEGKLTAVGSSTTMTLKAQIDTDLQDFEAVVNANLLQALVHRVTSEEITLSMPSSKMLTVVAGGVKSNLVCTDGRYIEFEEIEHPEFECETNALKDYIEQTAHALDRKKTTLMQSRYLVEMGDKGCNVTTWDGFRVSYRTSANGADAPVFFALEGNTLKDTARLFSGKIKVSTDKNRVMMKDSAGLTAILLKSSEAAKLNLEKFLSMPVGAAFTIDREELCESLKLTSIMAEMCELDIGENEIRISSKSFDNNIDITCKPESVSEDFTPMHIGVKSAFLVDALSSISKEKVTLEFTSPKAPIYIRGEGFTELVMPITLK